MIYGSLVVILGLCKMLLFFLEKYSVNQFIFRFFFYSFVELNETISDGVDQILMLHCVIYNCCMIEVIRIIFRFPIRVALALPSA